MPKSPNQKSKLLYLMKIFLEETDDSHALTLAEIKKRLLDYGISTERKSLYDDFECLRDFGLDVVQERHVRSATYHIGNRLFENSELKLLVDTVQSARFVPKKKSKTLIDKLASLASSYDAQQLQRQVYVAGRIKAENNKIYYNVDTIQNAIAANGQIRFRYFSWTVNKKPQLRHDGAYYQVSPWALCWDNENYYLIAYNSQDHDIRHYRVDKMLDVQEANAAREGRETFRQLDMAAYEQSMFSMFAGQKMSVEILCTNGLANPIIDQFGQDVMIQKKDEQHFVAKATVAMSRQFLHWVMALANDSGDEAVIIGPPSAVEAAKAEAMRVAGQYS